MKTRYGFFLCLFFLSQFLLANENHKKISPSLVFNDKSFGVYVVQFKGRPQIERKKDGIEVAKASVANKNEKLRGHIEIQTDINSEIVLQIEPSVKMKIYPESEVIFPHINWETGSLEQFTLKSGRIRWHSEGNSKIKLISDLYESVFPAGTFVVYYSPKTPQVQVLALNGEIQFNEKNGEESIKLTEGKKVHFLGKLEDGEIAYDLLLHDRKIPKGQKSQVENLSAEDIKNYSYDEEIKALELERKKLIAKSKKAPLRKNEICKKPNGIFNECAWICEGNPKEQHRCRTDLPKVRCIRTRCNANGEWAERFEVDRAMGGKLCQVRAVVRVCDY